MRSVSHDALENFAGRVLIALGAHETVVADTSRALVESSLCGVDTHGISLLPKIAARVRAERSQVAAPTQVRGTHGALTFLDARGTPGQHAAMEAVRHAISSAKRHGLGFAAVDNSTHFGGCVPFLRAIDEAGLAGVVGSNSLRSMAAFGSRRANLGNNPFGFVIPSDPVSFVFDSSAAVMSFGRRAQLLARGEPVPPEAFVPQPEAEPEGIAEVADSLDHLAVPFGGHKGASIAVLIEFLSALMSGGNSGRTTETLEADRFLGPSHFALVLDPMASPAGSSFRFRVGEYLAGLHRDPDVRLPGERLMSTRAERLTHGIPLEDEACESLLVCAQGLAVEPWS